MLCTWDFVLRDVIFFPPILIGFTFTSFIVLRVDLHLMNLIECIRSVSIICPVVMSLFVSVGRYRVHVSLTRLAITKPEDYRTLTHWDLIVPP